MLTRSMKAASEDFEVQKLKPEDEMTSVSANVSELRSKVSRDQGINKNLSKVNASFPSTDGNRGLQLNQTMSAVTETDVQLNWVAKQLNDLTVAQGKDRDNFTRKIEMLAKKIELTDAQLRHEMKVLTDSPASTYQGCDMDEERDPLKSIARDAREKPNKEAALEEKKRKKAQVQLRNEEMLKYRC